MISMWVSDAPIEAARDQFLLDELAVIELDRAGEETDQADQREQRTEPFDVSERTDFRVREVRQKELRQPGRGRTRLKSMQQRRVDTIEVRRERRDHDDHLERRRRVNEDRHDPGPSAGGGRGHFRALSRTR